MRFAGVWPFIFSSTIYLVCRGCDCFLRALRQRGQNLSRRGSRIEEYLSHLQSDSPRGIRADVYPEFAPSSKLEDICSHVALYIGSTRVKTAFVRRGHCWPVFPTTDDAALHLDVEAIEVAERFVDYRVTYRVFSNSMIPKKLATFRDSFYFYRDYNFFSMEKIPNLTEKT